MEHFYQTRNITAWPYISRLIVPTNGGMDMFIEVSHGQWPLCLLGSPSTVPPANVQMCCQGLPCIIATPLKYIDFIYCGISNILSIKSKCPSPLIGPDFTTHLTVLSSRDREVGRVTGSPSISSSTTHPLGVVSFIPARGAVGVEVCHVQVDYTSPTSCASTCVTTKIGTQYFLNIHQFSSC